MKNYRRLSGDGSVKVVLSGDSNSPPKTTPRREPLPCNSSSMQELRTPPAVPFAFLRVHSRFQKNVESTPEAPPKFQKKPLFALIRGLCDGHPAPEFSTTAFLSSATTDHEQLATDKPENVDLACASLPELSLAHFSASASATLKQPPLQTNDLRQFSAETEKNTETLKLKNRAINFSNVLPPPAISALSLQPSSFYQNRSFQPRVGTPRKSAIIEKYRLSFSGPNLLQLSRCQPKPEVSAKADTFCPCTNHLRGKNLALAVFFGIRSTSNLRPLNLRTSSSASRQNRSKKPVSSPKFMFQHWSPSPLFSASVVKFDQSQNAFVSLVAFCSSLRSLQNLVQNFIKSPSSRHHFSRPPFAKRTSILGN
jgi:hypothetical protein